MSKILILGAGGVANVTAIKCAKNPEIFSEILLASRTLEKCEAIAKRAFDLTGQKIATFQIDVKEEEKLTGFIAKIKPDLVINLVDPYYDLIIMRACLAAKVNYMDTANYEPENEARLRYDEQWEFHEEFKKAGLMAVLGCGFDPGVTNAMTAYALKHHFKEIHELHIMDCNAGSHGYPFATNFSPEINIREVSSPARFWKDGAWKEIESIINPKGSRSDYHFKFNYSEIGPRETYLIYHEELQSLVKNIPNLKFATFGMTFGEEYLTHLRVLQNVGITRIDPVSFQGKDIIPVKFLEKLLPDPSSLAKNYTGKTNIGCVIKGIGKEGEPKEYYIYNICDHEKCYQEVGSQAISYTAGVPPMTGAKMILSGKWKGEGVFNVEELDPDPFMESLSGDGLPWTEVFGNDVPEIKWS
jgi:saccharopine dehydrogenase (NAD+, L-lysine forming)